MMTLTLLIDESGKVYDSNGWAIRSKLGVAASGSALVDYAVRNCGYIELKFGGSKCSLKLAPGRANYVSFSAASTLIDKHKPERMSLAWYDGEWHYEIVTNPQAAFERIVGEMWANRATAGGRFRSHLWSPLDLPGSNPLKTVFGLWQASGGSIDFATVPDLLNSQLRGKYAFIVRPPGSAKLSYTSVRTGIEAYRDQSWHTKQQTVADQPDYYYGRFLLETYREAMLAREPTLLDVDGHIEDPQADKPFNAKYTRLALPLVTSEGYDALFCASVPNRSIDLW